MTIENNNPVLSADLKRRQANFEILNKDRRRKKADENKEKITEDIVTKYGIDETFLKSLTRDSDKGIETIINRIMTINGVELDKSIIDNLAPEYRVIYKTAYKNFTENNNNEVFLRLIMKIDQKIEKMQVILKKK